MRWPSFGAAAGREVGHSEFLCHILLLFITGGNNALQIPMESMLLSNICDASVIRQSTVQNRKSSISFDTELFFGSGRRIRTLTYGVRVRCATFTQSRYIFYREKTSKPYMTSRFLCLAAGEGFEPSHTESESAVLPLHNPAIFRAAVLINRSEQIILYTVLRKSQYLF